MHTITIIETSDSRFIDKWTMIDNETKDVYTMSDNAKSPQGVNQFAGNGRNDARFLEIEKGETKIIIPVEVLRAMLERLEEKN